MEKTEDSPMLKEILDVGSKVFVFGKHAAAGAVADVWKELVKTPQMLNAFLEETSVKLTPIEVIITCVHTSDDVDDYHLDIDHQRISDALQAGTFVRPKIVVKASRTDLNRDLLAERLLDGLKPLVETFDSRVIDARKKEVQGKFVSSLSAGFDVAEIFISALFLCLIGAGAMLGPIFWLAIGIGGIGVLREMPSFIIGIIKHTVFGTPIEQLEKEVDLAKQTIKKMVHDLTIVATP